MEIQKKKKLGDILNNIPKLKKYTPEEFDDYLETFEAIRELKKACFGFTLDPDYKEKVRIFELKWAVLRIKYGVSITNKCHVIIAHLIYFIMKSGKPLGEFSEQAIEAAHQKFKGQSHKNVEKFIPPPKKKITYIFKGGEN